MSKNSDLLFKRTTFFTETLKEGGMLKILASALSRQVFIGGKTGQQINPYANENYDWGYSCTGAENFAQMIAFFLWDGYTAENQTVVNFIKTNFTAQIPQKTCLTLLDVIKLEKVVKKALKIAETGLYETNGNYFLQEKGKFIDYRALWKIEINGEFFHPLLDLPNRSERENMREFTFGKGTAEYALLAELPEKSLKILKTYICTQKSQTFKNAAIEELKMDFWYKSQTDEWRFINGQGANFGQGIPTDKVIYELK